MLWLRRIRRHDEQKIQSQWDLLQTTPHEKPMIGDGRIRRLDDEIIVDQSQRGLLQALLFGHILYNPVPAGHSMLGLLQATPREKTLIGCNNAGFSASNPAGTERNMCGPAADSVRRLACLSLF